MAKTEEGAAPSPKTPPRPNASKLNKHDRLSELERKLSRLNRETLMQIEAMPRKPKHS
jgi:hypothetical protein